MDASFPPILGAYPSSASEDMETPLREPQATSSIADFGYCTISIQFDTPLLVTMAELFWVGSAGRTGENGNSQGGRTWQNLFSGCPEQDWLK